MSPTFSNLAATRTGLRIGSAYVRKPMRIDSLDAVKIQSALLEPRTAKPLPVLDRVLGRVWSWL